MDLSVLTCLCKMTKWLLHFRQLYSCKILVYNICLIISIILQSFIVFLYIHENYTSTSIHIAGHHHEM